MIRGTRAPGALTTRRARDERGAAAVEFALLMPLLLLLVSGVIAFGISLWVQINAASGGREAARLAAVGVEDCDAWAEAVRKTVTFPAIDTLTMNVLDDTADGGNGNGVADAGDQIRITFKYDANFVINDVLAVATGLFGNGVRLPESYTEVASTRAEQVDQTSCAVP